MEEEGQRGVVNWKGGVVNAELSVSTHVTPLDVQASGWTLKGRSALWNGYEPSLRMVDQAATWPCMSYSASVNSQRLPDAV